MGMSCVSLSNLRASRTRERRAGFSLLELMIGLVVFSIVLSFIFLYYEHDQKAQAAGLGMAEAQQNARVAVDMMSRELRSAGYGIDNSQRVAIETASQYRVTFVLDMDGNGTIGAGERITYFLDSNRSDAAVAATRNPRDRVIRRVASTVADSLATPASGAGEVIAYAITQGAGSSGTPVTPLFSYYTKSGTQLTGSATDPTNAFYGTTLPDSVLGKPAGSGRLATMASILIRVTAETPSPSGQPAAYKEVTLSARVSPRTAPYIPVTAASNPPVVGGGGGSGSDSLGGGAGGGGGTDSLPDYQPPIRIPTSDVLSLILLDLNEEDDHEGSLTTQNDQRDLDIVVGTKNGTANNLLVYWNGFPSGYTGWGLFRSTYSYSGTSSYDLYALAAGNIDGGDSKYPDVVAGVKRGATNAGAVQAWLDQAGGTHGVIGSGSYPGATSPNGTYYRSSNPNATGEVRAMAIADLNNDGRLDVLCGTKTGTNAGALEVFFGNGTGGFTHASTDVYTTSYPVYGVCIADINHDGYPDLVGCTAKSTNSTGYIEVRRNSSGTPGTFSGTSSSYSVGKGVYAIAAGDLDLDGYTDVVIGTKSSTTVGDIQYWRNVSGTLTSTDTTPAGGPVTAVAIGTIDYGNHVPDVVAGTSNQMVQAWYVSDTAAGGHYLPQSESWSDRVTGGSVSAVAIGKLEASVANPDADILNDIVVGVAISSTSGEIDVYLNPYVTQ